MSKQQPMVLLLFSKNRVDQPTGGLHNLPIGDRSYVYAVSPENIEVSIYSKGALPSLSKNIQYVWFEHTGRLHHVWQVEQQLAEGRVPHQCLRLGNMFVVKSRPVIPLTSSKHGFVYRPVEEFGLAEVKPGYLIRFNNQVVTHLATC